MKRTSPFPSALLQPILGFRIEVLCGPYRKISAELTEVTPTAHLERCVYCCDEQLQARCGGVALVECADPRKLDCGGAAANNATSTMFVPRVYELRTDCGGAAQRVPYKAGDACHGHVFKPGKTDVLDVGVVHGAGAC